ncbi:MAG: division plane positioning ATPase MipZ [Solirubrobacterales bacterium]
MEANGKPRAAFSQPSRGEATGGPGYLASIRAHKLLVALITLATVGAALLWLGLRTPTYEANAKMLIAPLPQNDKTYLGLQLLRDSGDPTRTAETAATLAESLDAARIAAGKLGPGWDEQKVLDAVSVIPEGQSNILAVTAKSDNADEAARVANTFVVSVTVARDRALRLQAERQIRTAEARLADAVPGSAEEQALISRVDRLNSLLANGDPTITPSEKATPPTSPTGAGPIIVIPLALIAGLVLGTGTAALFDFANSRVRDESELVQIYRLPVLARIPILKRPERSVGGVPSLFDSPAVLEAFRTILAQLETTGRDDRTLMVTSASTGDGKTTSSLDLALALAGAGNSVVLLDLDLRKADLANKLELTTTTPAQELLWRLEKGDSAELGDLLVELPHPGGDLKVLTIGSTPEDAGLVDSVNHRLPALLAAVRREADYVVIDTPPLGEISDALRVAQLADAVIMVARVGNTRRRNLEIAEELLERTGLTPTGYLLIGGQSGTTGAYYRSLGGRATAPERKA